MQKLGKTVIFLMYTVCSMCETVSVTCPQFCECDLFEDLRRATCINRRLVTVQAFIPNITQILDVSFNQIIELPDHAFYDESLLDLQLLNISHNILSHIHINAFYGLNDLRTLDLSFNSLEHILPNWFWSLKGLQELYLSGNRFRQLSEEPLFESKSLKILDMSQCKISSLSADVFIKITNLVYLDISRNDLVQLDIKAITPLKNLNTLKINGNSFKCDEDMKKISSYCNQNGIAYTDPCKLNITKGTGKQFEKMVVSTKEEPIKKNFWIYDSKKDATCNNTKIIQICSNKTEHRRLIMEIIELSPELTLLITLICGILIGLIIGCGVQIHGSSSASGTAAKQNRKVIQRRASSFIRPTRRRSTLFKSTLSLRGRRNDDEENESLVLAALNHPDSTPLCTRKFDV